jgi:hypothetical protein
MRTGLRIIPLEKLADLRDFVRVVIMGVASNLPDKIERKVTA